MSEFWIDLIVGVGIPLVLLILGFVVGSWMERRHFRRLIESEDDLRGVMGFAIRRAPRDLDLSAPKLVTGSAVISVDYFKRFAAGLRHLIGGRVGAYESLFERARRQAVIRMKEEARAHGADMVLNIKFETVRIFGSQRGGTISVEALVYGTAYRTGHGRPEIPQP
jgi:uncharacterized protein YbjQ (UPF0145 family)